MYLSVLLHEIGPKEYLEPTLNDLRQLVDGKPIEQAVENYI